MTACATWNGRSWASMTHELLRDFQIPYRLRGAISVLASLAEGRDYLEESDNVIRRFLGCSARCVQDILRTLEAIGLIDRERAYDNLRNRTNRVIRFKGSQVELINYFRLKRSGASNQQKPAASTRQEPAASTRQEPAGSSSVGKEEEKKNAGPDGSAGKPSAVPAEETEEERLAGLARLREQCGLPPRPVTPRASLAAAGPGMPLEGPRPLYKAVDGKLVVVAPAITQADMDAVTAADVEDALGAILESLDPPLRE